MEVISYSNFRQNLKSYMDVVIRSSSPLFIKRKKGEDCVLLKRSDFEGLQETLYLLSSPRNAQRINKALKDFENKNGVENELIEP